MAFSASSRGLLSRTPPSIRNCQSLTSLTSTMPSPSVLESQSDGSNATGTTQLLRAAFANDLASFRGRRTDPLTWRALRGRQTDPLAWACARNGNACGVRCPRSPSPGRRASSAVRRRDAWRRARDRAETRRSSRAVRCDWLFCRLLNARSSAGRNTPSPSSSDAGSASPGSRSRPSSAPL